MAHITIDVDIDEFDDDDLIEALEDRGYTIDKDEEDDDDEIPETSRKRMPSSYTIKRCFDRHQLRTHLENITGCGGYVSNEELLEQLKYLLENG